MTERAPLVAERGFRSARYSLHQSMRCRTWPRTLGGSLCLVTPFRKLNDTVIDNIDYVRRTLLSAVKVIHRTNLLS